MRYVEKSLTEGERIVYTTRRHWVVLVGPWTLATLLIAGGAALLFQKDYFWIAGLILLVIAAGAFISGLLRRYGFEFAVTNKRVIYCQGLVSVSTDELFLDKIESVLVKQGLLGRWWGYGSVSVRGTGGSWEPFAYVADPLMLRRRIQEQIEHRSAPVPA
ncbi:MAG TPA: PH domain-containing protein [Candidatus Acidoferrales bacterium]|nr:PH domain-containing protein [Candidatus Acidoferrales bacterium]